MMETEGRVSKGERVWEISNARKKERETETKKTRRTEWIGVVVWQ